MDEDALTKLATEELLKEARRGAARAESMGPQGWLPCPLPRANKKFLTNTIQQAVDTNRRISNETNTEKRHKK